MTTTTIDSKAGDATTPVEMNPGGSKTVHIRWVILILLSLGAVIGFIDRTNIGVVLTIKDVIKLFHLTNVDRGVLNSAFFWSYALLQVPMGWVVDRYGVKRPYAIGFCIWCFATVCAGFANTMHQLTVARLFTGAGESVVVPATYKWIRNNFAPKDGGKAIGIYMLGTKLGPAIAAPLATFLIYKHEWRAMFFICGIGGLVWLIPWMFLADDKVRVEQTKKKVTLSSQEYPTSLLLKSPVVWGAIIVSFCYNYFMFYCMTWLPAYFVESRHLSIQKMGLWVFFNFLGLAIVTVAGGWIADSLIKTGKSAVMVRKCFTIAGFLVATTELLGVSASSNSVALFWALISLSGLGLAAGNNLALTRMHLIPSQLVGRSTGIEMVAVSLAGMWCPIISGYLLKKSGSYMLPMQVIWVFLIIGVLGTIFLLRPKYSPVLPEKKETAPVTA